MKASFERKIRQWKQRMREHARPELAYRRGYYRGKITGRKEGIMEAYYAVKIATKTELELSSMTVEEKLEIICKL